MRATKKHKRRKDPAQSMTRAVFPISHLPLPTFDSSPAA